MTYMVRSFTKKRNRKAINQQKKKQIRKVVYYPNDLDEPLRNMWWPNAERVISLGTNSQERKQKKNKRENRENRNYNLKGRQITGIERTHRKPIV